MKGRDGSDERRVLRIERGKERDRKWGRIRK